MAKYKVVPRQLNGKSCYQIMQGRKFLFWTHWSLLSKLVSGYNVLKNLHFPTEGAAETYITILHENHASNSVNTKG